MKKETLNTEEATKADGRLLETVKSSWDLKAKTNCKHKQSKLRCLQWHEWADRKIRQGHKQRQCPKCKLWLCEL